MVGYNGYLIQCVFKFLNLVTFLLKYMFIKLNVFLGKFKSIFSKNKSILVYLKGFFKQTNQIDQFVCLLCLYVIFSVFVIIAGYSVLLYYMLEPETNKQPLAEVFQEVQATLEAIHNKNVTEEKVKTPEPEEDFGAFLEKHKNTIALCIGLAFFIHNIMSWETIMLYKDSNNRCVHYNRHPRGNFWSISQHN